MIVLAAAALSVAGTLAVLEPTLPGPCDILSKATVTALLGQPAPAGTASGPEKDEDTGGMASHCFYQVGSSAVIVSQVVFTSAAEAKKATTAELIKAQMDDTEAKVTQENGVGDTGYWATTEKAAFYAVLKGPRITGVGIGGNLPKAKATYHDALREAALAAASR